MSAGLDPVSQILACALSGPTLTGEERRFFAEVRPAGVTLFRRNIPDIQHETSRLTADLQEVVAAGGPPMIVAIDQEGGRVRRLQAPFPDHGPAMSMARGADDEEALAELMEYGREVGGALGALGINVDFAPVVDVLTEQANIAIGDRAFGTDVEPVCKRAGAWLEGLQQTGVKGCLKHFPGQGDAKVDTHVGKALVDLPRKVLDERELVPYRALLSQVDLIMISHCIYPDLAPEEASRSPRIIGQLLRGEMGYQGVVVSDDMNMGAIPQDETAWTAALCEAVAAGVDLLLVCENMERSRLAWEALKRQAGKSKAFRKRVEESAARVWRLRQSLKAGRDPGEPMSLESRSP